jgi:hypothetical protein
MLEGIKKHFHHYFSLIAIMGVGVTGFYLYRYDQFFQIGVITSLALSYISWGIIHHTIHKDISLSVILEYVAVSILGSIMIYILLFNSHL